MSDTGRQLVAAAMALPERERAELAGRLIGSLDGEADSNWGRSWEAPLNV